MRIAGWAGVAFFVLSGVIVVAAPFWPPLGASAAEVVTWYRAHRMPFLVANYLAMVAAVPSFIQLAYLCMLVRRAEGERGWLWIAMLGSATLAHAMGALALTVYQAVPFQLAAAQAAVAKGLSDLAGVAFAMFLTVLAGFLGVTAWALFATKVLPRWLAQATIPMAVVCFIGSFGAIWEEPRWLAGGGFFTAATCSTFFVWCLIVAVLFLRMKEPRKSS
jgi:hypothetical protein